MIPTLISQNLMVQLSLISISIAPHSYVRPVHLVGHWGFILTRFMGNFLSLGMSWAPFGNSLPSPFSFFFSFCQKNQFQNIFNFFHFLYHINNLFKLTFSFKLFLLYISYITSYYYLNSDSLTKQGRVCLTSYNTM
jgi:hypothetical protein